MVRNLDGTQPFAQGNAINAYTVPSFFLRVAEFYVKQKFTNIKKLWTYIQETEDGRYISEAGYHIDHYVKIRDTSQSYGLLKNFKKERRAIYISPVVFYFLNATSRSVV